MVTVEVVDSDYNPGTVVVNPGDTVRWVMRGSEPGHTVTALNGAFNSGFAFTADGATFQHSFTAADDNQTFEYSCVTHAACCNMRGSVRVGTSSPPPLPGYE